jgi:hypothetical protein
LKRTIMFVVAVTEPSVRSRMFMLLVPALLAALFAALVANPAEARTRLKATPSTVDFGESIVGDPSPEKEIKLKNNGTRRVTIFLSISGADASSFSVPTDRISIAPGKTTLVPVTFITSGSPGTKVGSLELKDRNGNTVRTVPLSGVLGAVSVEVAPSSLDFGTSIVGDPSVGKNVTLKNNGTSSVTITPSISGTNASAFSVPTDPITIAPGDTAKVTVTFRPASSLGVWTGDLELKDSGGNTILTVPLRGVGRCPIEG